MKLVLLTRIHGALGRSLTLAQLGLHTSDLLPHSRCGYTLLHLGGKCGMLIGQVVNFLQQRFFGVALGQLNLAFLRLNVSHDPVVFFRRYVAFNFLTGQIKALIQCFGQSIPFSFFFVQLAKFYFFFFSLNAVNGALVSVTQGGTDNVFFTKQIKGLSVNTFWLTA